MLRIIEWLGIWFLLLYWHVKVIRWQDGPLPRLFSQLLHVHYKLQQPTPMANGVEGPSTVQSKLAFCDFNRNKKWVQWNKRVTRLRPEILHLPFHGTGQVCSMVFFSYLLPGRAMITSWGLCRTHMAASLSIMIGCHSVCKIPDAMNHETNYPSGPGWCDDGSWMHNPCHGTHIHMVILAYESSASKVFKVHRTFFLDHNPKTAKDKSEFLLSKKKIQVPLFLWWNWD